MIDGCLIPEGRDVDPESCIPYDRTLDLRVRLHSSIRSLLLENQFVSSSDSNQGQRLFRAERVQDLKENLPVTSIIDRTEENVYRQHRARELKEAAELPLFQKEKIAPVFAGKLETSIALALFNSFQWKEGSERVQFDVKAAGKHGTFSYRMLPRPQTGEDIATTLPMILDAPLHLGVDMAKFHIIFCAYALRRAIKSGSTDSSFSVKGTDLIHLIRAGKSEDRSVILERLAKHIQGLAWLNLMEAPDEACPSTSLKQPIWNVDLNRITKVILFEEKLTEIIIEVKPGPLIDSCLKQLKSFSNEDFTKNVFSLTSGLLKTDSYHNRLVLKLGIFRNLHWPNYLRGKYKISNLLRLLGEVFAGVGTEVSWLESSLNRLRNLTFTIPLPKEGEVPKKYLVIQPLRFKASDIERWKRAIRRQNSLPTQPLLTASQIKEARRRSKLTLEELAQRVDVSVSKLSKLENGRVRLFAGDSQKLQRVLAHFLTDPERDR